MGLGFGQLAKIRGIIYYKLSPFEQKAFGGVISKGIPNTIRRISENFFTVAPRKLTHQNLNMYEWTFKIVENSRLY